MGLYYISECPDSEKPSEPVNTTAAHPCLLETLSCCQHWSAVNHHCSSSLSLFPFYWAMTPARVKTCRLVQLPSVNCALGWGPSLCSFCAVAGTTNSCSAMRPPQYYCILAMSADKTFSQGHILGCTLALPSTNSQGPG